MSTLTDRGRGGGGEQSKARVPRSLRRAGPGPARSSRASPALRQWCAWFGAILLLCLGWALATPRFGSPDEGPHVFEAAALGRGEFFPPDRLTPLAYLGEVRIPATYNNMSEASACFTAKPEVTPECAENVLRDGRLGPALSIATRYPPLYYLVLAPLTRVLPEVQAMYAMRLVTALLGAALLATAFVIAQSCGRWAVLGVAAAATPMALYLTSVVNPSGLEIVSATALWTASAVLARGGSLNPRLLGVVAVSFLLFANARGFSLPMAVGALLLPLCLADRSRLAAIAASRSARRWFSVVVVAATAGLTWSLFRGRVSSITTKLPRFTVGDGLRRTWTLFEESVAWFGLVEVRVRAAVVIWLVVWGILLVVGLRRRTDRVLLVVGSLVLVAVVLPIVVSLLAPPPIYTRFHGRYSLPLWIGIPILCGIVASSSQAAATRSSRRWWVLVSALIAVGHVVAFATAAHRYAVGSSGRILYVLDPDWSGPVAPVFPLLLVIAGGAWLAHLVSSSGAAPVTLGPRQDIRPRFDASRSPGTGGTP